MKKFNNLNKNGYNIYKFFYIVLSKINILIHCIQIKKGTGTG